MNTLAQRQHSARQSLDAFTAPDSSYAFRTYDVVPANSSGQLRPEDILVANLLSLRLGGRDVTRLFADGDGPPQQLLTAMNRAMVALREAPPFETYSSTDELDLALKSLAEANKATDSVSQWTSVTVSKVLHRHAPHIVPIVDSRVRTFYGLRRRQGRELRHRLWADVRENLEWLAELGHDYPTEDGRPLSVLRVADILIWMPSPSPTAPAVADFTPSTWDREGLEARGWKGFVPLLTLSPIDVPNEPGVYAIVRNDESAPVFLPDRPQATARQATPYSVADLSSRWVPGASVLNIGKAGTSLRSRLRQYRQFGAGVGLNHKGGRSIWQLADAEDLTVAWHPIAPTYDGLTAKTAESVLISAFQAAHEGSKPYSNLLN